ncbi:MAG: DNA mismatch repair endonuclease MutH [Polyangiales bacterium]
MLPPRTEEELVERARHLTGRTLGEIAARLNVPLPESQARAKGLVGQLMEKALGASAGSRSEPDFLEIGVELKTLPVGADGKPKESTFVASLPLMTLTEVDYEDSFVAKKLVRVLWVPIQADPAIPLRDRRVGRALLWSPTEEERAVLRADYERIAHLVLDGAHADVNGRLGTYLQVRPKAADSQVRGKTMDDLGQIAWTGPRGFYLRPQFTLRVLRSMT